ncbi:MAG TPA: hypothetical protein VNB90_14305 [Cytophagaceae bacterium]|nr:hypothetical protein [Cytophagaceae bacterium]
MGRHMNFYEEEIESYLAGKLNNADKLALEENMKKDPLLKNEVELQRDIIESLKNTRKAQLKNRLNNIDVSSSATGVSSAVKIAASIITVGIIGAGLYYFSVLPDAKDKEKVTVVLNDNLQAPPQLQNVDSGNLTQAKKTSTAQKEIINSGSPQSQNSKGTNNHKAASHSVVNGSNNQEITAHANVPNGVIADTESDRLTRDVTVNIPDGNIGDTNVGTAEKIEVNVEGNKNDFSYKYFDNKLFLYGDFKDQPYSLFEINTPKAKRLYLNFDGKFYELKSNQSKLTRLKEVKDASVLEQLNKKK